MSGRGNLLHLSSKTPNRMEKKRVLLTGATGVMGTAVLQELLARSEQFDLTLLVLPSCKNRRKMKVYASLENVRIVWGDLRNYDDVLSAVAGADYVLHVGGMVSPKADHDPETTLHTNIVAARNIVRAVKVQPDPDRVKVVYIGSVAQTGDRQSPLHWARTGDPIAPSIFDYYAISKCVAERVFAESGLKYWVSLRQSGILYAGILRNIDPIMFHVPIREVLEWATVEDSGRLLAKVCEEGVPESFWRKFYNIGSGAEYRLTNYRFEQLLLKNSLGLPPEKLFASNMFATRNFHGQWYLDSDRLEEILHFRANIPVEEYFEGMRSRLPWFFALAKWVPAGIMRLFLRCLAHHRRFGTLGWLRRDDKPHIAAYFGSREEWKAIPDWRTLADFSLAGEDNAVLLNHGYDEYKSLDKLNIDDMRQAAAFRGGKCVSKTMIEGDLHTPLEWECACGHRFTTTPAVVLLGGYWCHGCFAKPWQYDAEAQRNPFFAQLWLAHHKDENNDYSNIEIDIERFLCEE